MDLLLRRRSSAGRHIHHHQRFKEQYTLDTLSIGTHFTKREIQSIYRGFKQIRSYELPKITQYYVGQQDSCYVGIDHQPDTTCSQQLQLISFEFNVQNGWTKSPVSALNGSEALTCIENWTDEWASLSEWSLGIRHIERDLLPTVSSRNDCYISARIELNTVLLRGIVIQQHTLILYSRHWIKTTSGYLNFGVITCYELKNYTLQEGVFLPPTKFSQPMLPNEYLLMLSSMSRGSINEKLHWIFNLYDVDRDGYVTMRDMLELVSAVYDMMHHCTRTSRASAAISKDKEVILHEHVQRFFKKFDPDEDGIITRDKFMEKCLKDENIIKSLAVLDTVM
ncbi:Kv channel-interacting protein 4 [Nymphon striatum]|nr:Kv channel-interacting protein 4 [Nymphon striatum]